MQCDGAARLTDEIVDEVVYPDSEYKIYELANALSRKNYSAYVKILSELSSKGFDEISLLNSLCYYFKGLYEVSLSRGSDREVAAALGIKEYAAKKNREQAAKFPKGELFRCYRDVYEAIGGIKCGELTPVFRFESGHRAGLFRRRKPKKSPLRRKKGEKTKKSGLKYFPFGRISYIIYPSENSCFGCLT